MSYINTTTNQYPVSERDIRDAFPNTSFSEPFSAPEGYAWVFPAPQPTFNPITQTVREIAPVLTVKGTWEQQWEVVDLPAEVAAVNQAAALEQTKVSYTAALDAHYLEAAKSHGYDTQYTCALRAGYPGPFHNEGVAFATWMDNCNVYAYGVMSQVMTGAIQLPTMTEFIDGLPPLVWPTAA